MADLPSIHARARIRAEMETKHLSQRDVAGILGWTQSRVSKNLNGRVQLDIDDLAEICFAVGISLVEAVRDHGLEFCAEMTPTELRLLERFRQLLPLQREAFLTILNVQRSEPRHATAIKKLFESKPSHR